MNYIAKVASKEFKINLDDRGDQVVATINGQSIPIQMREIDGSHVYSALVGNRSFEIEIRRNEAGYQVFHKGRSFEFIVEDERSAQLKKSMRQAVSHKIEQELKAPMPGLVVAIEVKPGQEVKKGGGLLIIEAMKMENEIKAPFDCVVKEIKVQERQVVEKGQVLVVFGA
ncbi:MAG: biotin/lipoyl-binding protein [candidate division KSB1 bacterium]|nr:biotin/lipoyl-binding protein [candidate division KSB1 bacterium]